MTSMPPPGSRGGDGSWSYKAPRGDGSPSAKPAPSPKPATGSPGLDPLSKRLLELAAGLSVLLILVIVVAWLHGSEETTLNPIAQAAARTQRQPGSRIAISGTYSLPTGQTMAMRGSGVYNGRSGRSRSVVEVAVPGPIGSIRMESVGDQSLIFLRSKVFSAELPPGDRWLAIQPGLGGAGQAALANNTGSESQLEVLRATGGEVEDLGEAEVRGVSTTRYAGTIDLSHYADHLAGEGKAAAAHEYEQLAKAMPEPMPVEAWLDEAGLVRQMRLVMPIPSEDDGPPVEMDMTMTFFDFGTAPEIALPDRNEAFDATPLTRAKLHLLDGRAIGVPAQLNDGSPMPAAAFHERASAICRAPDRPAARLQEQSQPLGRRVREAIGLVKTGAASRRVLVRLMNRYAETYMEPVIALGARALERLARLSPPPSQRVAVQEFVHMGAVALEANAAVARAFELGALDQVKELMTEVRTYTRRAKAAARAAGLDACAESSAE